MIDARLSVSLPSHPKTKKLIKRLGTDGAWRLVCLFLWVAQNKSDGDLSGMAAEDIELAVDWPGQDGAFVSALIEVGFLNGSDDDGYCVHDWQEHNPWAAGSEARSEKSKWAALCRRHGRLKAAEMMPEYASRLPESASSTPVAVPESASSTPVAESSTAPLPSPLPSPLPLPLPLPLPSTKENPIVASKLAPCPQQEIIAMFGEMLPELPQPRVWDATREKNLAGRWKWVLSDLKQKSRPFDKEAGIDFFRRMFEYVSRSDLLMGKNERGWTCSLPWLVESKNFAKVIEGNYENDRQG